MLTIEKASGLVTVQDLGWPTGRAFGLPRSGAVDAPAARLANALVGNPDGAAVLELALGAVTVRFPEPRRYALVGIEPDEAASGTTRLARPGESLTLGPPTAVRFGYLAVAGGIDVPSVLGSRSTYLPTGLGGLAGRALAAGDVLPLGTPGHGPPEGYRPALPNLRAAWSVDAGESGGLTGTESPGAAEPIRLVAGPQARRFSDEALARLESASYRVSSVSDRMGTRLIGPAIVPITPADLPSEGACLGAVQVPDDGQPIVLLVDGPTVGGYPKVAVIATVDFARFAQLLPGRQARFRFVSVAEAQQRWIEWSEQWDRALTAIRDSWGAGRAGGPAGAEERREG